VRNIDAADFMQYGLESKEISNQIQLIEELVKIYSDKNKYPWVLFKCLMRLP